MKLNPEVLNEFMSLITERATLAAKMGAETARMVKEFHEKNCFSKQPGCDVVFEQIFALALEQEVAIIIQKQEQEKSD